mmetsp:Transcript_57776/g.115796  ORF Transcript_57776/g.115796 Transcript_57776/m.115796 type:complete len:405 (-) Transcript_57776:51-1265(-)
MAEDPGCASSRQDRACPVVLLRPRYFLCGLCGALCLALTLASVGGELLRNWALFRPIVLEPPGLAQILRELPERRLSREEQLAFERDGVLLVRGFINNTALLEDILPSLQEHEQLLSGDYVWPYLYNGVVRAFLRYGPIGALAADAMQAEGASLYGAPIWGLPDGSEELHYNHWHQDAPDERRLITIWVAVTDAPHGLEFIRGSHLYPREILQECNNSHKMGQKGSRLANHTCVVKFSKEHLEPDFGTPAHIWEDLRPGDAWIFLGPTLHRGLAWARRRLALSVRLVPMTPPRECGRGDSLCCREAKWGGGSETERLFIYPRRDTNLDCIRDRLLPRPQRLWPHWDDRLPADRPHLLRLLAAVSQAAFGRSRSLRIGLQHVSEAASELRARLRARGGGKAPSRS